MTLMWRLSRPHGNRLVHTYSIIFQQHDSPITVQQLSFWPFEDTGSVFTPLEPGKPSTSGTMFKVFPDLQFHRAKAKTIRSLPKNKSPSL